MALYIYRPPASLHLKLNGLTFDPHQPPNFDGIATCWYATVDAVDGLKPVLGENM